MANYSALKAAIQQVIKTNGNNEITGALLQQTLLAMVNSLGGYYQFAGIAMPTTNPGTPDQNVYYIASTAGIYTNFGSLVLADGEIAILKYNGAWSKDSTGAASLEKVNILETALDIETTELSGTVIDGKFIGQSGTIESNAAFKMVQYDISEYQNCVLFGHTPLSGNMYVTAVALFKGATPVYQGPLTSVSSDVLLNLSNYDADTCYISMNAANDAGQALVKITESSISEVENKLGEMLQANYSMDDFSENGFINTSGSIEYTAGYYLTDFIPITGAEESIEVCAVLSNPYGGGVAFYDINKSFISLLYNKITPVAYNKNSSYAFVSGDIPAGAKYFRVNAYNNVAQPGYVKIVFDSEKYTDIFLEKNQDIAKRIFSFGSDGFSESGFINNKGIIEGLTGYFTTKFIPISGAISCNVVACMRNIYGGGIAFYNKDFQFISSIYNVTSGSVGDASNYSYSLNIADIPEGAVYIKVQRGPNNPDKANFFCVTDSESWYNEFKDMPISDLLSESKSAFPESSGFVEIENTPDTKNLYSIGVSLHFTTMGRIRISKGQELAYGTGKIEIDDTNIYVYNPNNPSQILQTIPHGLTLSNFIIVQINVGDTPSIVGNSYFTAELILTTNSDTIFTTTIAWTGCSGNARVGKVSGDSFSNISITFGGESFRKRLWVFGDSYTDFWPKYVFNENATNFMLDGRSGRGSSGALTSLKNALVLGKPKTILWMMGMNDGDSSSAVNTSWKNVFDELRILCKKEGIEFLPATIPNTPNVINYYKNAVIYNSGLKYVDIADILGATEISSSWYSGLLSGDNVHPTERGAKVIANYLIAQLPMMKLA